MFVCDSGDVEDLYPRRPDRSKEQEQEGEAAEEGEEAEDGFQEEGEEEMPEDDPPVQVDVEALQDGAGGEGAGAGDREPEPGSSAELADAKPREPCSPFRAHQVVRTTSCQDIGLTSPSVMVIEDSPVKAKVLSQEEKRKAIEELTALEVELFLIQM